MVQHIKKYLLILFIFMLPCFTWGQANTEVFGQNRIQYRKFEWKFFDTKHFRVYHYDRNGTPLARYVCEQAEQDIKSLERRMGVRFPDRFNIMLYNNYDEYRQTNIGLKVESQLQDVSAGTLNLVGDRLVVYFNGVHTDLRRQIRSGMVRIMMQRMLLGESIGAVAKNAVLQGLPRWTIDGYAAYVVDGWDPKSESEWKNVLDAQPTKGFYSLADQYPELAGKAFWKYIADRYGEETIRNLLRDMQQKNSLNKGVKMALGMKIKPAYDSCIAYYKAAFAKDALVQETPDASQSLIDIKLPKDGSIIRSMRISPRGRDITYCVFKEGEYKIYIQHTDKEQQRSLILSEGRKDHNELTPDADYPLLAWSNNGYKVAILYRHKLQTRLKIYNSQKARIENYTIPANRFDRILGMTFNETDEKIVFSAIKKSQTDLYLFTLKGSRMTNITNDVWDDIQPWFVSGGAKRGILFLSNRPQANLNVPVGVNELPTGPMNLYFYDTKTMSPVLMKCSDNKFGNITQPIQYGPENFAYLLDSNGIQNKYVVVFGRDINNLDSPISIPVTNYSRSILSHQYTLASNQVADVLQIGDQYKVFFQKLLIPDVNTQPKTLQRTTLSVTNNQASAPLGSPAANAAAEEPVVKSGNVFQTEFADTATRNPVATPPVATGNTNDNTDTTWLLNPLIKDSTYLKLKAQPYRLSFKPDFITLRLDNTVLFSKYQSVANNGGQFSNPPLGGMLSVSLNDALENHRFTGGIRLPTDLSGTAYFLQYQNFTRRVDWGIFFLSTHDKYGYDVTYSDSSGNTLVNTQIGKVNTNLIQGSAAYVLDRIRRIGLHLGFRQDALTFKAQDTLSLIYSQPNKQYWGLSRVEYVFDNSIAPEQNIRVGFRYKFFAEYMAGFSASNKGGFYNLGLDFRYYAKLYKNTIFAVRLSGAHSAGKQHILYIMGGVDGWLGAKNSPIPPNPSENYAFQALATNLRGYLQNARAGNTYALGNFEVRSPILTTILQRPIRSDILRSIQLVGFADVGSAWNGLLPDAESLQRNALSSNQNGSVIVKLNLAESSGLALGYGAGVRAKLLGYFMRLDAAWNIEGIKKPIWYFSIGTDF